MENNISVIKLVQDFTSLHLNKQYSDVVLRINGEKLYAHKVILAVRSDYFKTLLYGDLQESKQVEITLHDVPSTEAFKTLLEYIYTGDIAMESLNVDLALDVLIQAHKYCMEDLVDVMTGKMKKIRSLGNISMILNIANLYNFGKLKEDCSRFLDNLAPEYLKSENFLQLTQESIIELLRRDTFYDTEVEIFQAIMRWLQNNNCGDTSWITSCVRLAWMSAHDIVSIIRPTGFIDNNVLLNAIAQAMEVEAKKTSCRGRLILDKNVATPNNHAEVLGSYNQSVILDEKIKGLNTIYYERHHISDRNGLIIKLGVPHMINTINMTLFYESSDRHDGFHPYSYCIEISTDFDNWKRIIDYSNYRCVGEQTLHFSQVMALYIRIIGTHSSTDDEFRLLQFGAGYFAKTPQTVGTVVRPDTNAAILGKSARLLEGQFLRFLSVDGKPNINKNHYGFHWLNATEKILVHLNQPCLISSMLLVLYKNRKYRYYIQVSTDEENWVNVADFSHENREAVQHINFPERVVVFIRIVGLYSSAGDNQFRCHYFECPAIHLKEVNEAYRSAS